MKKTIWILLAALLMVAAMLLPALATNTGGIAAGEVSGNAGETVEVYLHVHDYAQVNSLAVVYNAVPEGLTVKDAQWLVKGDVANVDAGRYAAVWTVSNAINMVQSTDVFKITYQIDPEARGTIQFNITAKVKTEEDTEPTVFTVPVTIQVMVPATDVTLHVTDLTLDLSGTAAQQLIAQIQPADTTDSVTWSSTNSSVATVDDHGNVTAVKPGNAQIKVSAGKVSAVCNVTVVCTHSDATHNIAKTEDCENPGNREYYHCDACSQYLKADKQTPTTYEAEQLPKLGHDTTHNVKVDATCVATGTKENWYCSRCEKAYADSACTQVLADTDIPVDANNHTETAQWTKDATHHSKSYTCCGAVVVAKEAHEWVNGVCAECEYTCSHTGGTATCTQKAVCTICQSAYGTVDANNHTAAAKWIQDATHHSKIYDCCGAVVVAKEVHEWENGVCSECEYTCSHTGGTATCVEKAVCTVCQSAYGAVNPNNHTGKTLLKNAATPSCYQGGYSGDTHCKDCDALLEAGRALDPTGNHVAQSPWLKDDTHHWHACTTSGCEAQVEKTAHNYQWRVDEPATDEVTGLKHEECVCGVKRNEGTVIPKQDHVHGSITHYAAVPATCTKAGTVEYWTCGKNLCKGKYYADADCQLLLDTIVDPVNPQNHTGGTTVKDAKSANCYQDGYTGDTYCKGCGVKTATGSVIYATGKHKATGGWLTDGTYHWHACATPGCSAKVGKAAHNFSWVIDKEPTEEAEGVKHEVCGCGLKRNQGTKIEKLEHIPVLVAGKDNTCTEDGILTHYYCENCDRYFAYEDGKAGQQIQAEDTILKATGHSYAEAWETDGDHHWHVCHCGDIAGQADHTPKLEGAVEATKEEPGYTGDSICSVCGYVLKKGEVIPSKQEAVLEDIQNAQNGSSVQIGVPEDNGTLNAIVPSDVLEVAKGKDVELVLDMGQYQWTILGNSITGTDLKDIDLKVELNAQKIPAEVISSVVRKEKTLQLSLSHNGDFGFTANLSIDLGQENAGKTGKLYYYNGDKQLELVSSSVIGQDGKIILPFSHASDYVIVIEEAAGNAVLWIIVAAVVVVAAAAAVLIIRKKRSK